MLSLVPAFVGGMPGGIELLVIFVVMLVLFGIPLALATILGYRYVTGRKGATSQAERIEELEAELETLKAQVEAATSVEGPAQTEAEDGGVEREQ